MCTLRLLALTQDRIVFTDGAASTHDSIGNGRANSMHSVPGSEAASMVPNRPYTIITTSAVQRDETPGKRSSDVLGIQVPPLYV